MWTDRTTRAPCDLLLGAVSPLRQQRQQIRQVDHAVAISVAQASMTRSAWESGADDLLRVAQEVDGDNLDSAVSE